MSFHAIAAQEPLPQDAFQVLHMRQMVQRLDAVLLADGGDVFGRDLFAGTGGVPHVRLVLVNLGILRLIGAEFFLRLLLLGGGFQRKEVVGAGRRRRWAEPVGHGQKHPVLAAEIDPGRALPLVDRVVQVLNEPAVLRAVAPPLIRGLGPVVDRVRWHIWKFSPARGGCEDRLPFLFRMCRDRACLLLGFLPIDCDWRMGNARRAKGTLLPASGFLTGSGRKMCSGMQSASHQRQPCKVNRTKKISAGKKKAFFCIESARRWFETACRAPPGALFVLRSSLHKSAKQETSSQPLIAPIVRIGQMREL